MKDFHSTSLNDIRKAVGDPFTMSDHDIESFLERHDAGEIEVPALPPYLLPAPLTRVIVESQVANEPLQANTLEELALAARNGEEPLSEESIQRMLDVQEEKE